MALYCFKLNKPNPFEYARRVYEFSSPENSSSAPEESKDAQATRERIKAEFENEKLLPDTVKKLNEALAKAPEEELDMWLSNIERAMTEFVLIDALLAKVEENRPMKAALVAVYETRNDILKKLHLTLDDIQALARLRDMTEDRLDVLEAHLIQDPSKVREVKEQALRFVRRAGSDAPLSTADTVENGTPLYFDFTNPLTGKINTFAQRNITLADAMNALGVDSLQFTKKGSRVPVTAYLWPDRGENGEAHSVPNDGSSTASPSTYLPVLAGDSVILAKTETKPKLAPAPTTAPTSASVNLLDLADPALGRTTGVPRGAHARRGMTWDEQMELGAPPSADLTVEATASAEAVPTDYSSLVGKKVTLPKDLQVVLRKENPWEEIRNLKYKDHGGEKVYEAVNYLAERRTREGLDIDNRTMWESILGMCNGTVSFNEIVRAAYGINIGDKRFNKPGEWLVKEYDTSSGAKKAEYGEVLKAADIILTSLPKLKDSGLIAAERSDTQVPPEMADASAYTDNYLFDKDSLAAPVQVGVFRRIALSMSGDDRPLVTEDNWLDRAGGPSKEARELDQGAVAIVSQGEAYETLMETGSPDKYMEALNRYREDGEGQINAIAKLAELRGIKIDEVETHTEPITDLSVPPTEDQRKAIHYGMMLEAGLKLRIYQDATALLTPEEREERNYKSTGDVYGTGFLGASVGIPDGSLAGTGGLAARAKVLPGTTLDAGLVGSVWDAGDTVGTDLDARAGVSVKSRRFGENRRWQAGAGVHGEVDVRSGAPGADVDAYLMYDLDNESVWAAKGGVGAGVARDQLGVGADAQLGVERDFDRQFQMNLQKFKEDPESAAAIAEAKAAARATIDASDYDAVSKEVLKKTSDAHIDMLVEQGVMDDWVSLRKQIKLAGAGVQVGARLGLKNLFSNGVRVGPFITFAFGFKRVTYYVKPVSERGTADGRVDASEWIPDESEMVAVDLPVSELYIGGAVERAQAVERARGKIERAREVRNEALKDTLEFSREGDVPYDKVNFKALNGQVKLFVDPNSNIEMITDGSSNFLNVAIENNLNIFIDTTDSLQGGGNEYTIYISDQAGSTPESIRDASTSHLSWKQSLDGSIQNSRIVHAEEGTPSQNFYTLAEANLAGLPSKDKDAEAYVDEVTYEDLMRQTAARDATLFGEYSEADFQLASTVGKELIANGVDYDTLALGNDDAKIMAEIKALYIQHGLEESKINIDRIYMARQHAMEVGRPKNLEVPIEWNSDAVKNIHAAGGQLFIDFMTKNKELLEQGGLKSQLPTGSEFYISVSHHGVARGEALLLGYYDKRLHGDILAQVEWNAGDPDSTLRTLGAPLNEENRQAVRDMVKAIEDQDWPTSPFNTLSEANFDKAKYTIAGELLITNAEELYGPVKGKQLRDIAESGLRNAELEAEFLIDVQELLVNHHTMVGETPVSLDMEIRSGLYEKCFNLVVSRNFRLNYQTPQTKQPEITVAHRSRVVGLQSTEGFAHKEVDVRIGMPTFENKQSKPDPSLNGSVNEDEGADAGEEAAGEGEDAAGQGEHPEVEIK